MKIVIYLFVFFLFFNTAHAKEFRIDFTNEGMKMLKKKGFGKKIGAKLLSLSHSSFLEEGYLQQSPWTKGSRDYVISNDKSGEWHTRKVNVKELLLKTHNISFTNFLAVFTDSNNSKQKIIAYYRDIYFSDD